MSSVSSHRPGRLRGFGPGFQAFVCRSRVGSRLQVGRRDADVMSVSEEDDPAARGFASMCRAEGEFSLLLDEQFEILWHTSSLTEVLGYESIVGRNGMEFIHPDDLQLVVDLIARCRRCRHERHVHRAIVPTGSIGRAGPHRVGGVDRAQLGGVRPHHGSRDPGAARELPSRRRSQRHRPVDRAPRYRGAGRRGALRRRPTRRPRTRRRFAVHRCVVARRSDPRRVVSRAARAAPPDGCGGIERRPIGVARGDDHHGLRRSGADGCRNPGAPARIHRGVPDAHHRTRRRRGDRLHAGAGATTRSS